MAGAGMSLLPGDIAEVLELDKDSGAVELWPATNVVPVDGLPGDDAEQLAGNGWRNVYFKASQADEASAIRYRTTFGKPLAGLALDSELGLLEPNVHDISGRMIRRNFDPSRNPDGFTLLPMLLAVVRGPDNIDLVACPSGTSGFDYWTDRPAGLENNFPVDDVCGFVSMDERVAMARLNVSLSLASHHLMGEASGTPSAS